jgi:hypothetical protein
MTTWRLLKREHRPPRAASSQPAASLRLLTFSGSIRASGIDVENSVDQLKKFKKLHKWDPNLPIEQYIGVNAVLEAGDVEKEVAVEQALLEENSPYPEVVSAVRNYDE